MVSPFIYRLSEQAVDQQIIFTLLKGENMSESTIITFYVSIGIPPRCDSHYPLVLADHVMVRIDSSTETLVQRAKQVRKEYADDKNLALRLRPSELYYEIYPHAKSKFPYCASANSPAMNCAA